MYNNVDEVLQKIAGTDLARANRFFVQFFFPGFGFDEDISHAVESIEIPNLSISTVDYQLNSNPLIKIPYARTPAQTCTITFREVAPRPISKAFTSYLQAVINNDSGEYFVSYPEQLWGQIVFKAYNTGGVTVNSQMLPTYRIDLIAAMPTTVESVQYSHDERDSYIKQTITFSYHDVEVKTSANLNDS